MNHQQRLAMQSSHLEMPDLDLSMLDERQKIFVLKYITNGFNGAAAAKASHYPAGSAKVRASEMLSNADIKSAIASVMDTRCKVLGIDANWVLEKAVTIFERCMQTEKVIDQYGATGEYKFDAANAIKALSLVGKHVDVRAFESKDITINIGDEAIINRLVAARHRVAQANERVIEPTVSREVVSTYESIGEPIESSVEPPAIEPEISFMHAPVYSADHVTDASEPDVMLSDEDKLAKLMEHWRR